MPGQDRFASIAGRWFVGRLLAAVLVIGVAAIASQVLAGRTPSTWVGDPSPPENVSDALASLGASGRCQSAAEYERLVRTELTRLGSSDWQLWHSPGLRLGGCVSSTIDTMAHKIILIPAMTPDLREALKDLAERTYEECLSRAEATTLLIEVLGNQAEIGWEIRTDGPVGGPIDRLDEIMAHVKSGCHIYSGTGWDETGRRLFYVVGL